MPADRAGQPVRSMVVPGAEPEDVERLGIVAVMAVDFGIATHLAGEARDFAGAHGIAETALSCECLRIVGAPPIPVFPRLRLSMRQTLLARDRRRGPSHQSVRRDAQGEKAALPRRRSRAPAIPGREGVRVAAILIRVAPGEERSESEKCAINSK